MPCLHGAAYVGSSINIDKRWKIHARQIERGMHRLGLRWPVSFVLLERCTDPAALFEAERRWSMQFETTLNRLAVGPSSMAKISESQRARLAR